MTADHSVLKPVSDAVRPMRAVRWASRIGVVALIGIGLAHTIVNGRGFAAEQDTSWTIFLLFGPGVSLVAFAIAVAAWRYGHRVTRGIPGVAIRLVVALGAVLLCATAVSVVRTDPSLALIPLGPGPWSVIGGPALLVAALIRPARSHRQGEVTAR